MYPEALAALKKKNNGTCGPFALTGLKNVADLVESSDEEEEKPSTSKTQRKSFLGDIMEEAKKGGWDFVSPEKKKEDQQKKENYERTHTRPELARTPVQERRQPPLPHGLPDLQMLQHLGNALKDGTAFKKGPAYQPVAPYRPEEPALPKTPQLNSYFYPRKSSPHFENSSQVSFCQHQDLRINWDPLDPDNRDGSWKLSMKDYFHSPSEHEDHKSCPAPNLQQRAKILAGCIIQKFSDMETGKLTARDRRNGKEPRRPPPTSLVEREIRAMIPQMSRGKHENVVEKREAARVKMDAIERRKELEEMVQQQAQQERQRGEQTKGLDDDREDDEKPGVKAKKLTKRSEVNNSAKLAESTLHRLEDEKRKMTAAPKDRYRVTTMHERDERRVKFAEEVRTDLATEKSRSAEKQKIMPVPKRAKISQKPQKPQEAEAVRTESDEDTETASRKPISEQPTRRQQALGESEGNEPEEGNIVEQLKLAPRISKNMSKESGEKPKEAPTQKPRKMTAEECALLAGIRQAEEEEIDQHAETERGAEANERQQSTTSETPPSDEELVQELATIQRPNTVDKVTRSPAEVPVSKPTAKDPVKRQEDKEVEESWDFFETAKGGEEEQQANDNEHGGTFDKTPEKSVASEDDVVPNAIEKTLTAPPTPQPVKKVEQAKSKKRKAPVIRVDADDLSDALPTPLSPKKAILAPKPVQKKRKAPVVQDDEEAEHPRKKKGRKDRKSASIIEDSDAEADYKLPDVESLLPATDVRQGWQAEGAALVEEVAHQQEEEEQRNDQTVKQTVELTGTLELTEGNTATRIAEAANTIDATQTAEQENEHEQDPPRSQTQKRKHPSTLEETSSPPSNSASAPPPPKKLKPNSSPPDKNPIPPASPPQPQPQRPDTPPPASPPPHSPASPPHRHHNTTPPISPTVTPPKKRKNPFFSSNSSDEDDTASPPRLFRPIKKAKKVRFEPDLVSPVAGPRKMSIPYIIDGEGDAGLLADRGA